MVAFGRNGNLGQTHAGHHFVSRRAAIFGLACCFFLILTVNVERGECVFISKRFDYAGGVKRGNVSGNDGQRGSIGNGDDNSDRNTLISRVEDANARRIQTLYQLLEHRPETQTCYNGRSDRTFRFYCPTPSPEDIENGWQCITIDDLCNNIPDCPGAEDEDLVHCMFYMAIQHQTQTLRQIIVRHYEEIHTVPNTVRT